jgi:succinate dehydrogenase/fumarate reductase cytochrome b subunit
MVIACYREHMGQENWYIKILRRISVFFFFLTIYSLQNTSALVTRKASGKLSGSAKESA